MTLADAIINSGGRRLWEPMGTGQSMVGELASLRAIGFCPFFKGNNHLKQGKGG